MKFLLGLVIGFGSALAKDFAGGEAPARFNSSNSYAVSTIPGAFTTLYANPESGQQSSAQFPYTKEATKDDKVNPATVYLVGKDFKEALQTGFAIVPQECSCYWIDSTELITREGFKALKPGNYSILIEEDGDQEPKYRVQSGIFAIDTPRKLQTENSEKTAAKIVKPKKLHRASLPKKCKSENV